MLCVVDFTEVNNAKVLKKIRLLFRNVEFLEVAYRNVMAGKMFYSGYKKTFIVGYSNNSSTETMKQYCKLTIVPLVIYGKYDGLLFSFAGDKYLDY